MIDMVDYGWKAENDNEVLAIDGSLPARVILVQKGIFRVVCQEGECSAKLKGKFYQTIETAEDVPVVGDFVWLRYNAKGESLIESLVARRTKFSRPDFSGHKANHLKTILEQVIAANFDYVFILTSLNSDFKISRIERYLSVARQSGAEPVVVLTKADTNPEYEKYVAMVQQLSDSVAVVAVSVISGFGLDQLQCYLQPGKTIVFLGSSGVGKSSLVNSLAGEILMQVQEIREKDAKGRHTTSRRQLFRMRNGCLVIDTPGMRELGLWYAGAGLQGLFADIEKLIQQCRFSDCSHQNEPGCAIQAALNSGLLEAERWLRYRQLIRENDWGIVKSGYTKKEKLHQKMNRGSTLQKKEK